MEFPNLSIRPVHLQLRVVGWVFIIFIQILIEYSVSKQCKPRSDTAFILWCVILVSHCLHMRHKKDAMLIWVKSAYTTVQHGHMSIVAF